MSPRRRCHRRAIHEGAAAIVLVVTLGILSCALLSLCSQTATQSQVAEQVAMEQKQCDALLELGEEVFLRRLRSNADYLGESFQVHLPWSIRTTDMPLPFIGSVSIEKLADTSSHREWRISVSCGIENGTRYESMRSIHAPINSNPVSTPGNVE